MNLKKGNKIAIIHFLPLEYYPPVINFLNLLPATNDSILVFSSHNALNRNIYVNERVSIFRYPFVKKELGVFRRLCTYLYFNLIVFVQLLLYRPDKVLYYESNSSFPAYLYLKLFRRKQLFIHFHEYFDNEWYRTGMRLVKIFHQFEISFLFKRATWISHTNQYRLNLFHADYPFINKSILKIVPNYPSKSWRAEPNLTENKERIRMVYIGALSFDKTYIREVIEWVIKLNGSVSLDVFSYNLKQDVKEFLQKKQSPYIFFDEGGVEYDQIPAILTNYSIGLVLYKGITTNYRYNATNKLFEYLICGLDVLFPEELEGIYPYMTKYTYPKVVRCDFNALHEMDIDGLSTRTDFKYKPFTTFAENAFKEFYRKIFEE